MVMRVGLPIVFLSANINEVNDDCFRQAANWRFNGRLARSEVYLKIPQRVTSFRVKTAHLMQRFIKSDSKSDKIH